MSIHELCAIGIIAAAAVMVLRDAGAPHPEAVVVILGTVVMGRAVVNVGEVISFVRGISEGSGVGDYVKLLLKAAGIAYIVDFASDLCRSSGEGAVAEYVELAGKSELVILSLPVIRELLDLSLGMLQ